MSKVLEAHAEGERDRERERERARERPTKGDAEKRERARETERMGRVRMQHRVDMDVRQSYINEYEWLTHSLVVIVDVRHSIFREYGCETFKFLASQGLRQ
jgi:hypothetical protein